jgi:hypothetical protein
VSGRKLKMIDMPQDVAVETNDLFKALAEHHGMTLGVVLALDRPGRVTTGDVCSWT